MTYLRPQRLDGHTALITGGAAGIGKEFVHRLAMEGADIVIVDVGDASESLDLVNQAGRKGAAYVCDVSDPAAVRELKSRLSELTNVDVLINNAGIYPFASFDDMTFEQWSRVLSVNLDSMFLMTKLVLPSLRERGWGRIVCMSSVMFHAGVPGAAHYVASKGGVIGFVRALAAELAPSGITINSIAPSLVRSQGTSTGYHENAGMFEAVAAVQAIRRTQVPDDLSGVLAFLVSDDARFITGQTLAVDGGYVRS